MLQLERKYVIIKEEEEEKEPFQRRNHEC